MKLHNQNTPQTQTSKKSLFKRKLTITNLLQLLEFIMVMVVGVMMTPLKTTQTCWY